MNAPLFDFEISGAELNRAARWLDRLAPGRVDAGREYLSGIHVFADLAGMQVHLSGTNLETYGVASCPTIVRSSGRTIVSARLMAAIAKTCKPSEVLRFESHGSRVTASTKSATWTLPTMSETYWPSYSLRGDLLAELDTRDLTRALQRVSGAVSKELVMPTWGGLAIEVNGDGRVRIAATDKYRLAVATISAQTYVQKQEVRVPAVALDRALMGSTEAVTTSLSASEGGCILSGKGFRASTRLLTEYPAWQRLVPKEPGGLGSMRVGASDLKEAMARAAVVQTDEVPFFLEIEPDSLTLIADGEDSGYANATCSVQTEGEIHPTIALRAGYLPDLVNGCGSESIEFTFGEHRLAPVIAYPVNADGVVEDDYVHIVRPVDLSRRVRAAKKGRK